MKKNMPQSMAGNMLIYILGAIFLMGILIVALKGNFQEGTGIDAEKNGLLVGQVQRYGAELERGVSYILRNGYSETDIRFSHPNAASAYGLITDIPARQVFDPVGGGVEWRDPPAGSQAAVTPWMFNGGNMVQNIGSSCTSDASCVDLLAILPNVTKSFCLQVNNRKGIENPSGNPPQDFQSADIVTPFAGTYTYTNTINDSSTLLLQGHPEGCFEGGGGTVATGTYHYYRVLLAR